MTETAPTPDGPDRPELEGDAAAGAPTAPESYEAAVARLEEIIARLDSGKAELRETLGLVREGKGLVEYCKAELDAVSGELEKLDLDQLVDQLEAAGGE
jgi:exodeoxyribonuclease VII small subunit